LPAGSQADRKVRFAADRAHAVRFAATLGLSAAGGLVANLLGLPAGWISGGLLAVAIASLAGVNTDVPQPIRAPVYLVLGLYSGGGVSQQTLHQMQTWPASFAILGISVIGVVGGSYWWLNGRCGWDRNSALLASLPGALSFVMAVAEGLKADMKKVAISQSLRVLLLVELIPLVALVVGHPSGGPAAARLPAGGPFDLAILFAAGIALSLILERLKLPGGWILGGLLASATLLLTGTVEARLPQMLVVPCTIALAAITGSRFRPGDLAILPHIARPALVAFGIASLVSAVAAVAVTLLIGVNFIQTLLAFAPGALDALTILAYQMNIDPAYVAAHHVVRFVALVAAVPILARWLGRSP
jgi:membrane AbrB-like protein